MELLFLPLYRSLEEDLKTLEEFVDKNLKKRYIKESSSLVKNPILFALKSDNIKRIYIDFRKFNDITIKDYYALLLVDNLRDKLQRANIFT